MSLAVICVKGVEAMITHDGDVDKARLVRVNV